MGNISIGPKHAVNRMKQDDTTSLQERITLLQGKLAEALAVSPVETIKEVIKEIYLEKIVEIPIDKIVEIKVDRIVDTIKEVIKIEEIIKEVPVEVIREVQVPIDRVVIQTKFLVPRSIYIVLGLETLSLAVLLIEQIIRRM